MAYTEGLLRRHGVGHGHVALHGGLGPGRPSRRHPGHARALRRRRRGLRLLRDARDQPAPARDATRTAPTGGCAPGSASSTSSTARPRRSGPRPTWPRSSTPASTRTPRESIWEVQESLQPFGRRRSRSSSNRGILGPRTVVAHCVWLDDREIAAHGPDRHRRGPLPVLEHEALVGPGPRRRLAPRRDRPSASAATARRRTTTSTSSRR